MLTKQLADFVTDDHNGNLTVKLEQTEVGGLASLLAVVPYCDCMGILQNEKRAGFRACNTG